MKGLSFMLIIKICLLFTLVYATALFIPMAAAKYLISPLMKGSILKVLAAAILLVINFILLLITATLSSGLAARIFNLKYSGRHRFDLRNREVAKWLLSLVVYLPIAVVLDFFHLYPLKSFHVKLFGGKIGKGVIVGGLITDPCLIEVDDDSVIGGFSTILCHAVERGIVRFKQVKIGKQCGVGTRSTILPGAVMADRSFLAAHSFLPKNQTIPAGKIYGGVPAMLWKNAE